MIPTDSALVRRLVTAWIAKMSRVQEIKAAIDQLSPEERCELTALFNSAEEDEWDRQMKKDAEPGEKLHRLMEAANITKARACRFRSPLSEVQDFAAILEAVLQPSARDSKTRLQELFALGTQSAPSFTTVQADQVQAMVSTRRRSLSGCRSFRRT
jgi:hypothetical protein